MSVLKNVFGESYIKCCAVPTANILVCVLTEPVKACCRDSVHKLAGLDSLKDL